MIESTPPSVRCKQPATKPVAHPPEEAQWVDSYGRLSEPAATWIVDVLAILEEERKFRKIEHGCLDEAEKAGHITQ